jgi:rhomboid-like protein
LEEYPYAVEDGLKYLRQAYPIDEDEAILYRIEREEDPREKDHPSVLMQRGQDLGLYKTQSAAQGAYYGPQSGYYQAELSEKEHDPYGKSELDRIRAENDAKRAREEEELQAQIDAEMAKAQELHDERSRAIAQRPEQGLETAKELRPPNSFERWVLRARNRAQSKLDLESPEIAHMSTFRRVFPSFLLAASLCVGCYFFAQAWTRPKQSDRIFPDVSLSSATIGALIALNAAVWILWKLPPYWSMLNKYFLFVPAYPYALSNLGTLFSHQKLWHLSMNMFALSIFGLPLHEEIGRGNFLAIYFASGLIGGFASFARHVIQGNMATSVLGASGCVYGIMSAYLALHMK